MKNKILETIKNNELFSKYISQVEIPEPEPKRYYIIPIGDKSNVFKETLNNKSQPNTVAQATTDYLYAYSTAFSNRISSFQTKEAIDLSQYSKIKYHFEITGGQDQFLVQIGGTTVGTFAAVGKYNGEINIANYNSLNYINIVPQGISVKFYYFYLEE